MASRALDFLRTLRGRRDDGKGNNEVDPLFRDEFSIGSTRYLIGKRLEDFSREALKAHLAARKLPTEGAKADLVERLKKSLENDMEKEQAYVAELDEERRMAADLEERGSVYVVGCNAVGQLGLGDLEPRRVFTVVPQLIGMGVCHVATGMEITFAVTEDHHVYVFGSLGMGPTGNSEKIPEEEVPDIKYTQPVRVEYLKGEDIVAVSVGASHAAGISAGGDCFVWGVGSFGRLGLGHDKSMPTPQLLSEGLPRGVEARQCECGQSHSVLLTNRGSLYTWGHVADGRLGLGTNKRLGFKEPESKYFPSPTIVSSLKTELVKQVSCGSSHTLALSSNGVVWSWGCGAGGRLGHGDVRDRFAPTVLEALQGSIVTSVAAGFWHSAALVAVPPLVRGKLVYTWGSGYCGQLGQGDSLVSLRPQMVEHLMSLQVFAVLISCGSHHNAIIDTEGEMWTWGSNKFNCLGRTMEDSYVEWTATPGHVGGFGAIVDRVGRGMPRAVACGKEYTVVATYPYQGPSEEVAQGLMEQRRLREQELAMQREAEAKLAQKVVAKAQKLQQQLEQVNLATAKRLCVRCKECPGYQQHAIKMNICRECGHSSLHHKVVAEEPATVKQQNDNALLADS